jgi:hypothetical protein
MCIHDYITKPSWVQLEMNLQMQVFVNDPNTCNAASSGDSLYFCQQTPVARVPPWMPGSFIMNTVTASIATCFLFIGPIGTKPVI